MRREFPLVFAEYEGPIFKTNSSGEVRGLGPDGLFAQCLGPTGRPEAPTVYCPEEDTFYGYDPDERIYEKLTEYEVQRRAGRLLRRCGKQAGAKGEGVHKLEHRPTKRRIRDALKEEAAVSEERFCRDLTRLPVVDGMLDLEELELEPLTPRHFARWKLPVRWSQEFRVPRRFMRFLRWMFPDAEDRRLAIDVMAMALAGNPAQRLVLLTGDGGTGKSTVVELLQELLGPDASGELDLENAGGRFESLKWKDQLLLHQMEASSDLLKGNGRFLKALSGQDSMEGRRKYANETVSFRPKALPLITANTRLRLELRGDQHAWRRRLVVLETQGQPLTDEERVQDFHKKLIEAEGPAILRLLAVHASRLLRQGFRGLTPRQQARAERTLEGFDPLPAFVREQVVREEGGHLYGGELYAAAAEWLNARGHSVPSRNGLARRLGPLVDEVGGVKTQSLPDHPEHSSRGWRQVRLRSMD